MIFVATSNRGDADCVAYIEQCSSGQWRWRVFEDGVEVCAGAGYSSRGDVEYAAELALFDYVGPPSD